MGAVTAIVGAAPPAAVVADGVEEQPAAAAASASAETFDGRALHEVQSPEGKERRNVAGRANVDVPARRRGNQVAAGDRIGERTVERITPSERVVRVGVVAAGCEVVVEVLAKVADPAQAAITRAIA